jgi:uncharacterized protein (DUF58 family)
LPIDLFSSRLTGYFFFGYSASIVLYAFGMIWPMAALIAQVLLFVLVGITLFDAVFLFSSRHPVSAKRTVNTRMNLGDKNEVRLELVNESRHRLKIDLFEGYPVQMQKRERSDRFSFAPKEMHTHAYDYVPSERGNTTFGDAFMLISSVFGMLNRRVVLCLEQQVYVYPSVLQMKKFELLVFQQKRTSFGLKRIRRIGHSREFEQIKPYVQGEDIRFINWKATGRKNEPMVNQFQEEKSQSVYCIIDKSRSMKMTEEGMNLLDYAINSALVLSNIAIRNGDKMGLLTFSDKLGVKLPADGSRLQLNRIMEALYAQQTAFPESDFELLYQQVRSVVKTRSLLVLFTNFETEFAMRRALPMLRQMNRKHQLLAVLFELSDLSEEMNQPIKTRNDVYQAAVAERLLSLKSRIASEMNKNGIKTLVSNPQQLSLNTVNKYLEIKSR